jgi:ABC-2 type transport system ATP-binding protein
VVEPNSVSALLGPNRSGKTTLVRVLTTLLKADSGSPQVGGYGVVALSQKVRSVIGLASQYPAVDESLSGRENLEIIGQLYQ